MKGCSFPYNQAAAYRKYLLGNRSLTGPGHGLCCTSEESFFMDSDNARSPLMDGHYQSRQVICFYVGAEACTKLFRSLCVS